MTVGTLAGRGNWKRAIASVLGLGSFCLFAVSQTQAESTKPAATQAVVISDVRLWAGPESTRVVLDISENTDYKLFTLSNPPRAVIDLPSAKLKNSSITKQVNGGYVSGMRTGARPNGGLRVVLDLASKAEPKGFTLRPNELYGHRLVVDLAGQVKAVEKPKTKPRTAPALVQRRELVIAIDAGHGGEDPGAIGPNGAQEKDVVMNIAEELQALLKADPGYKPVMIRGGDYYISLDQRIAKAREANADLFLSIHANSFNQHQVHGSAVYVLSRRGATTESARWLEARENASDLVGGIKLEDKDDMLASVLLDLSQAATMEASLDLGAQVLKSMGSVTKLHKRSVQQANFVVLRAPDIPSLLIETAFISNPFEERKLTSKSWQRKFARAIRSGVHDYFRINPVPGSYLASAASSP